MKKKAMFYPLVLSRHPSHNILRRKSNTLPKFPFRSVIRFGSTTDLEDTVSKGKRRVEINTIEAVKNSASKLRMKQCFTKAGVRTAPWWTSSNFSGFCQNGQDPAVRMEDLPYPIVAKHHFGSKGKGNTLIKSKEELDSWMVGKTPSNYIFEQFMNYAYEYRLHISKRGCFYTCRKALKKDVAEDQKWRRHDDVCVWFLENNPEFRKPFSWKDIVNDCVKALEAVGADLLSFDVRVQSDKNEYQDYILIECNSASSMDNGSGTISVCAQKYIDEIPKILMNKITL
jgi:glutathione synthase/RimK-type ligase-like ATP-grasp enzyme